MNRTNPFDIQSNNIFWGCRHRIVKVQGYEVLLQLTFSHFGIQSVSQQAERFMIAYGADGLCRGWLNLNLNFKTKPKIVFAAAPQ